MRNTVTSHFNDFLARTGPMTSCIYYNAIPCIIPCSPCVPCGYCDVTCRHPLVSIWRIRTHYKIRQMRTHYKFGLIQAHYKIRQMGVYHYSFCCCNSPELNTIKHQILRQLYLTPKRSFTSKRGLNGT